MGLPVVVCIGSSSVSGDSLGPMVGDLLKEEYLVKAYVYGDSLRPVNGVNFASYCQHIKQHHPNSFVVAVDACVGEARDVGRIKLTKNGVQAGGALGKNLERIGDIGVLGVVAKRGHDNLSALMNAPFPMVEALSGMVAEKVVTLLDELQDFFPKQREIGDKMLLFRG